MLRYFAQYVEYIGDGWKISEDGARSISNNGREIFFVGGKTWATVQTELEEEQKALKDWHRDERQPLPGRPIWHLLQWACHDGDFIWDQVQHSSKWYSQKDKRGYCEIGIGALIRDCDFQELERQISADIDQFPQIFDRKGGQEIYQNLIKIRSRYFVPCRYEGSILTKFAINMRQHGQ